MSKKAKLKFKPENPRDTLGLTAAEEGDLHGVEIFLSFVKNELTSLGCFSMHPEPIALRLRNLSRECETAFEYVAGFHAAGADGEP